MGTRAGGSALLWPRDRAARRLGTIEAEICRILEQFPALQERTFVMPRRSLTAPRRARPQASTSRYRVGPVLH